jgi:hypothetical protein
MRSGDINKIRQMKLESIIKLRLNNFEVKVPVVKGGMDITPNPCYEGYEPIGLKDDGSPNCVPIKASKENFVIPSPEDGEDENTYISRCVSDIAAEYDQEGQAYAVCKGKWDEPK